jgi:hypothetical protein
MENERFFIEYVDFHSSGDVAMSVFASATSFTPSMQNFSAVHVIRSALAFERILERSTIEAFYDENSVVLEGRADSYEAIDKALELARSLTDCQVVNHIEAAY